jgi:hypothetical protein
MANGEIRLHPKFGVNSTMPVCWWCGKPTGEVALLGAAYKEQAPMHMIISEQPCKACKAKLVEFVCLFEATSNSSDARTGRTAWVRRDALDKVIKPGELLDTTLKCGRALIEASAFTRLVERYNSEVGKEG